MISKLFKDLAIPDFVGLGQVAADDAPTEAKMIRLVTARIQVDRLIPKAITIVQLSENHTEQLVPAGKMLNVLIPFVLVNHPVKNSLGYKLYNLSEYIFSWVHRRPI